MSVSNVCLIFIPIRQRIFPCFSDYSLCPSELVGKDQIGYTASYSISACGLMLLPIKVTPLLLAECSCSYEYLSSYCHLVGIKCKWIFRVSWYCEKFVPHPRLFIRNMFFSLDIMSFMLFIIRLFCSHFHVYTTVEEIYESTILLLLIVLYQIVALVIFRSRPDLNWRARW